MLGRIALAQVGYWTFGALWPLLDMKSFERVTGNKRDEWLVRTVALMMLSVSATLAVMGRDRRRGDERAMRVLGATSTAALGSVALIGPLVGRISMVYLVDAVVDLTLAAGYLTASGDEETRVT